MLVSFLFFVSYIRSGYTVVMAVLILLYWLLTNKRALLKPRFCIWLQNLPRRGRRKPFWGFVGVNPDQNAMHFASAEGKFCYCKIWVKELIGLCNGLLLLYIGINLVYWVYEIFTAWYGQSNYEQWAATGGNFSLSLLAARLLLDCLLMILLLVKKWRRSIGLSIVVGCLNTGFAVRYITGLLDQFFFHDYLPSAWSVVPTGTSQPWLDWLLAALSFTVTALAFFLLQRLYRQLRNTGAAPSNLPETKKP